MTDMQCRGQSARLAARRASGLLAAVAAAFLVVVAAGSAEAGDKVYTVANYPVEAAAENAVLAKRKALAEGQQAAFRSLLKRLMPVMAYPRAKQFAAIKAVELIEGVKVRSERNSSTEYSATYDFYFRAKTVRDLLRREGIPFTDEQAPVVTLIPLWQASAKSSLGSQTAWVNSWKGLDLENSLTPVSIEPLLKEVPAAIAALPATRGAMHTGWILQDAAALMASPSPMSRPAARRHLAGKDAVGTFVLTRQPHRRRRPGYAEIAAIVALRTLEALKSVHTRGAVTVAAAPGDTDLLIAVEFRGMAEWQDISRKLGATPGVEELDVAGLSARGARVTLRYAGGAQRLAQELAPQGLNLRSVGGSWLLSLR
jgi:hypothetical protein